MKFTRRSVQTAALAVVGSLLASPAFAQDKPKIALIMKSLANEFFRTMEDGAKAHQKAHATEYTLVANGIKNETDTAAQIKMIEQAVAQKVNAIVLAPADSKALVPVVKSAIDKGILVVNIDNPLDADALKEKNITVPFVGPDNRAGAKLVGDHLAKTLKAGDKVGIIEGVSTTFNAQQRTLGYQDAMKAANITVVGVQSGNWEIEKGNTVAAGMMREHPDLVALLAGNDSMALGAVAAVRAAGKTGKVQVVGYDNIGAIKPMLADGRVLATADQYAAKQAVFGIELAQKALAAKTPQDQLPATVKTDVVLVLKDSKSTPGTLGQRVTSTPAVHPEPVEGLRYRSALASTSSARTVMGAVTRPTPRCTPPPARSWPRSGSTASTPPPRSRSWASASNRWWRLRATCRTTRASWCSTSPRPCSRRARPITCSSRSPTSPRGLAIIYVSHRLEELRRIADRVAVLRDGRLVDVRPMAGTSEDDLVQRMVGRVVSDLDHRPRRPRRPVGPVVMSAEGLGRGTAMQDVSLELRAGEILALPGWSDRAAPSWFACCLAPTVRTGAASHCTRIVNKNRLQRLMDKRNQLHKT